MNKIDMAAELFIESADETVPISNADAYKMSKEVLSAQDIDKVMMILESGMISKYIKAKRFKEILDIIDDLHGRPFMKPGTINLYLKQGSICESMMDYHEAELYYLLGIQTHAIMVEPDNRHIYWLFNNYAFCNNHERFFEEAQKLAEKAISINREQHNAWKNIGVSLEHQDKHAEVAACYMASHIKCGGGEDSRPMMHLERIFKRNDGLKEKLAEQAEKEMGNIFSGSFTNFCLGETYYYCGHFDKAIDAYEKFYAVAPSGYVKHLAYARRLVKELKELMFMEAQFK